MISIFDASVYCSIFTISCLVWNWVH